MKGFIRKAVAGSCLSFSLILLAGGCYHYRQLVDPCWPERYTQVARQSIRDMQNSQNDKGHLLQQTVWNWQFESDKNGAPTDRLNGAGKESLRRIARTLPAPDFQLFLQNAQDVPFVEGIAPEQLVADREQLNKRRVDAITRFMSTQGTNQVGYQVAVHDFAPTSLQGNWPGLVIENVIENQNYRTGIPFRFQPPAYTTK